MTPDRTVLLTTVIVLAVVVVSGPLVPGVTFTTEVDDAAPAHRGFGESRSGMGVEKRLVFGAATVPEDGVLEQIDGGYRVEVGPVELPVETGARPVTLRYEVRAPSLGFARESIERVPARTGRTVHLEARDGTVPSDAVTGERHEATLVVSVEQGGQTFPVAEETVLLEVER